MDHWVLKQLRAQVLGDLRDCIEAGYFEENIERFKLSNNIKSHKYLSSELHWGYQAGKLGKELNFESCSGLSPRQIAASEVLINMGILASVYAWQAVCEFISDKADELNVDDGNSGVVAKQLKNEQIPVLEKNVVGALGQYLKYLKRDEAAPFLVLVQDADDMEKNNSQKNVLNPSDLESTVQNIMIFNAPILGDIQQGKVNSKHSQLLANEKDDRKVLNFLFRHLGIIITTVIAGVILTYILIWLKIKP
jgi:hypothetical protein